MGYDIQCTNPQCKGYTWAANIVDLINEHTDPGGRLLCTECGRAEAFIHLESKLQEGDSMWERWVKGVVRIPTLYKTYSPYVFLVSHHKSGPVDGFHFNYYKDTREEPNGRLKHGHGPGGAPMLKKKELLYLLGQLMSLGHLSTDDLKGLGRKSSPPRKAAGNQGASS